MLQRSKRGSKELLVEVNVRYLHRNPTTGRLSFRRAYPPELRPHIPGQPVQLKRSLRTNLITAPAAMERYRELLPNMSGYPEGPLTAKLCERSNFSRARSLGLAYS
jgi:hypothetical protein